ncbi:MAG: ring-opening amidohydrolase [Cyanobacteriota bacterium]|nr:ring-opening amidohydrolase [Cyanobacteriota bacterium]
MPTAEAFEPCWDVGVFRLPMSSPADTSGVRDLMQLGILNPAEIVAIMAQTEGDGYARGYASLSLQLLLGEALNLSPQAVFERIPMMMIGLCGGMMSPHLTLWTKKRVQRPIADSPPKRLAVGVAQTRPLLPEEYGTPLQVELVAAAVQSAIAAAEIAELGDVHCVEIKCPAMTVDRLADAAARSVSVVSRNLTQASSFSKAASALGVAVALQEVEASQIHQAVINQDPTLFTRKGSVSAGGEQSACRVLVLGNSTTSVSRYQIGSGVMQDQLDLSGIHEALTTAGLAPPLTTAQQARITQVLINCGADAVSQVRGRRHTIHSDFLAGYAGIQAKAVAHAIVASVVGDPLILASAGAEHQGSPGSNLIAAIVQMEE